MNTIHAIGYTHFDPVWLWTWDEAMAGIRSTFRSALKRMDEEPDFVYSFCCPPVFEWIRATEPDMFAEIQRRVREGRWDLDEGWWLQPDVNAATGESYARHALHGQRYLERWFGRRSTTAFNSDSFGHAATLPQILKKGGISRYVFSRPSPGEQELPDCLFIWRSPDGSEVLAYRIESTTNTNLNTPGGDMRAAAQELAKRANGHDMMLIYGVSDHGGAPTRQAIAELKQLSAEENGKWRVRFGSVAGFFDAVDPRALSTYQGELQVRFFGTFSNLPEIKRNNRRSEYALLRAEAACHMASLYGRPYPRAELEQTWKDTLFNQFHDIIGGTCISDAYFDARNLHGRALQTAGECTHLALQYVARDIAMPGHLWNLVVFNAGPEPFAGTLEAEVQWVWELDWYSGGLEVVGPDGSVQTAQIVREQSVIPGFRSRLAFRAEAPALGWSVYELRQTGAPAAPIARGEAGDSVETPAWRLDIDRQSGALSLTRRADGRRVAPLLSPLALGDEGDTWSFNRSAFLGEAEPFRLESARITERGEYETVVLVRSRMNDSWLEQRVTLYEHEPYVDVRLRVNWNEKHRALKLCLPCGGSVKAAVPFGGIERPADGREYPVNEWLDCGGARALLDGISAYDAGDGRARLTLLRSPIGGDLRMGELDPDADYWYISQGISEARVRIYPEAQGCAAAQAAAFLAPPIIVDESWHDGGLPRVHSHIACRGEGVCISALKQAERDGAPVLRAHETRGERTPLRVELEGCPPLEAELAPYEIATFVCRDRRWRETDFLEE